MLTKLFTVARKDVYIAFQDRQALLIMFAAPLALSMIIAMAFGSSGDIGIDAVPLAVANQDVGTALPGGETINLGQTYQEAFVPSEEAGDSFAGIHKVTDGAIAHDVAQARARVEDGELAVLVTVPESFSQDVLAPGGTGAVDVYYDSGRSIGPSVVISITRALTNGLNAVILAQRAGPEALAELGAAAGADEAAIRQAAGQVQAQATELGAASPVQLRQVDLQGETRTVDALQYFAPSMAILFMTFAAASGATSILQEQERWTLQRIITTPTPRWVFMGGKLAGTYLTGVVQMVILILSTSLLAALMGREQSVWGTNYAGIALLVLAVVLAGTALGLLIAALAQTNDQANTYSTVALFVLGMLGGSFFTITDALPDLLPKLTLNYWGIQGFFSLSYDQASLGEIMPNLLALLAIGTVLFIISLWRFNRRLDL